ncbi:MAG: hypothetical protein ABIP93_18300 [Gemmatimonadaceae bacterium]
MSKDKSATGHTHDASDRALDAAATAEHANDEKAAGPGHDPAEISKHDDSGKDRLFEGRQQHDDAEKNSEKSRLAKDVDEHHHAVDDDAADAGTGSSAKRKS